MESTLFFNAFTEIDFADATGDTLVGRSLSVSALVTGEVDSKEKVVGDFSTLKKVMKVVIDGPFGPDHKCVIYDNQRFYDGGAVFSPTDTWDLEAPADAFFTLPAPESSESLDSAMERTLSELLTSKLCARLGASGKVEVFLNEVFSHSSTGSVKTPGQIAYFSYTHGLKDSTSYGCQNIAHGHRSFLQAFPEAGAPVGPVLQAVQKLAAELDGTMFVKAENVIERNRPAQADVKYENLDQLDGTIGYFCPRGNFRLVLNDYPGKVTILETETTVEYLAEYVRSRVHASDDYLALRGCRLFVSEGLKKGAVIQL